MTEVGRNHWTAGLAIAFVLVLAGCMVPQEVQEPGNEGAQEARIHTPDRIAWQEGPESLPPGTRIAVLTGDPTKEGPFTMRAEMPANLTIRTHTHHSDEHVTIISGTAYLIQGREAAGGNETELPPGSFFVMPPGVEHSFRTGDEPVVLQLHGQGPWGIEYVEEGGAHQED